MNETAASTQPTPVAPAPRWTIEYELTDRLHASAVWKYWLRSYGLRMIIVNGILIGYIALLWILNRIPEYRLSLTIAVLCVVLYSLLTHVRFFVQRRRDLHRLAHRRITLRLTDDTLYLDEGGAPIPIPWRSVLRIIKCSSLWLIKFGAEQFIVVPLDAADEGALRFIEERVTGSGGGHDDGCPTCYASFRTPTTATDTPARKTTGVNEINMSNNDATTGVESGSGDNGNDDAMLQFTVDTTDAVFRAAYKRFWWHDWPQYAVASGIVGATFVVGWWLDYLPNAAWWVLAVVAAGFVLYLYRDYYRYLRANLVVRKLIPNHRTQFTVRGEALHVKSAVDEAIIRRDEFRGVLEGPDYLILVMPRFRFVLVPTQRLSSRTVSRFEAWLADVSDSCSRP